MNKNISLHNLPKLVTRPAKRIGRGYGSGKAKTSGRGTKGQNARGTMKNSFEGGQLSLIKRMPYLRGRGRNKALHAKSLPLTLTQLSKLKPGTQVTIDQLIKSGLIDAKISRVKILAVGKLDVPLKVALPCSQKASDLIKKAGGEVRNE